MRCEVVAIGTELHLGQIVDTNSSFIGEQLALAGIDSHFYSASPDECAFVVERYPLAWQLESLEVFAVALPDASSGACPAGTRPGCRGLSAGPVGGAPH